MSIVVVVVVGLMLVVVGCLRLIEETWVGCLRSLVVKDDDEEEEEEVVDLMMFDVVVYWLELAGVLVVIVP